MTATKFIIPFIIASLAGHALVIALTARIDMTGSRISGKVLKVELKTQEEIEQPPPDSRDEQEAPPDRVTAIPVVYSEDTVALANPGGPYESYLIQIRRKIEKLWFSRPYPSQAYVAGQEGATVIRFTIDAAGVLKDNRVAASSGSRILDDGALAIVKAASPFEPLPKSFQLSQLHVTAEFHYQL